LARPEKASINEMESSNRCRAVHRLRHFAKPRSGAGRADMARYILTRVEALALVETLNASLLAARATFTLDQWCADHKLASDAKIRAQVIRGAESRLLPNNADGWRLTILSR
jgi:hypothetical protein